MSEQPPANKAKLINFLIQLRSCRDKSDKTAITPNPQMNFMADINMAVVNAAAWHAVHFKL